MHLKYFFTRKLLFVKESDAVALFPGGFGTQDEGFEVLTLVQTGKSHLFPIVMVDAPGGDYWTRWQDYVTDVLLARAADLAGRPVAVQGSPTRSTRRSTRCCGFYRVYHSMRYVGRDLVLRLHRSWRQPLLERIRAEFRRHRGQRHVHAGPGPAGGGERIARTCRGCGSTSTAATWAGCGSWSIASTWRRECGRVMRRIAFDLDETLGVPLIEGNAIVGFQIRPGCLNLLDRLRPRFALCLWSVSNRQLPGPVPLAWALRLVRGDYSWDELPGTWKDVRRIGADLLIDDSPHYREAAEKHGLADRYVVVPIYGSPEDAADPLAWVRLVDQAIGRLFGSPGEVEGSMVYPVANWNPDRLQVIPPSRSRRSRGVEQILPTFRIKEAVMGTVHPFKIRNRIQPRKGRLVVSEFLLSQSLNIFARLLDLTNFFPLFENGHERV